MDVPNEVEKIKEVLDKILPERDLNLVTIKSVRKDVADYLKVDESYFTDNKEKKAILKDILKDKLLKLYNEQQGKKEEEDDESTKTKSSNESEDEYKQKKHNQSNKSIKSDSKNNKKRKMSSDDFNTPSSKNAKKEKKNGNKKDDNSDNDNDELKPKSRKKSSGSITEKNIHTIKKEKLRKIVLDLKIGPTIFKDLNKENDEEYNKKLEEKIIAFCEKKEICSEKNRLPNPSEIQEYAKQLKLKEELDGIDLSNILDSGTRSRRRTPNVYTSKIIEGSEEDEEEDEEDEEDDGEEKNEEDDDEDDEEEDEEEDEEDEEEEDEEEEEYEEEEDEDDDD
ncbi:conserved Plasmodium protein, unknown function [Plasmodium vinckei lentum]|uniref:DEK C-terminal domain-containing protein n=1 Tax=Plasmodium vinckei lentum TaxID=138297 RepID=A0A6V7S6E7_PLAVN|nr:conserved Plasmodium protein, unknown function [Plasmodium vinckei lentum]